MVESEVKVKVRLEIDESDKNALREQASAIQQSGGAPIQGGPVSDNFRGGIFGDVEDTGVKGFQARTALGGGVQKLRDTTSNQAINRRNILDQLNDQEQRQQLLENKQRDQEASIRELITNPTGFIQGQIFDFFKQSPFVSAIFTSIPVISAILAAPQLIEGFISLLKDSRIIGVFRRELQNERNPFLTREQQRARQIGETSVIFTNTSGYTPTNGNLTTNTLNQVRANGISDIGLRDRALGSF